LGFTQDPLQPLAEIIAVAIPPKNLAAHDPPANDRVQGTRCIDAGAAWKEAADIQNARLAYQGDK
jgi:hypothetical protein